MNLSEEQLQLARMKKLICLDFDGVIIDSLDRLVHVAQTAQARLGVGRVPTKRDFQTVYDLSHHGFAEHIGIAAEHHPAWEREIESAMHEIENLSAPFSGIDEVLRHLQQLAPLCVISSNFRHQVLSALSTYKIAGLISLFFGSDDVGNKAVKLAAACAHFQVEPHHTVFIGDSRSDIRHGKQAGVRTVGVTWGYQSEETLARENPDLLVRRVSDLPEMVITLLSA